MVSSSRTDGDTDGQTHTKVNTEDTLSRFQEFSPQPIIKDRPNIYCLCQLCPDIRSNLRNNSGLWLQDVFFSFYSIVSVGMGVIVEMSLLCCLLDIRWRENEERGIKNKVQVLSK